MKKSFLRIGIVLGILLIFSSNKISNSNKTNDPIVGTWKSIKTVYNFSDRESEEFERNECFEKSRWTYFDDGKLNFKRFTTKNKLNECTQRPSDYWTGTWEKGEGNIYKIYHDVKYSEENIVSNSDLTDTFIFSENRNMMTVTKDYKKAGVIFEAPHTNISEYTIFERVLKN